MNVNRRSFLKAAAAWLAVSPEKLIQPAAAPVIPLTESNFIYRPFQIWENIIIPRAVAMLEETMLPPVPANFFVRNLHCLLPDEATAEDWAEAAFGSRVIMKADQKTYLDCAIGALSTALLSGGQHRYQAIGYAPGSTPTYPGILGAPMLPELRPERDFRVSILTPGLDLQAPEIRITVVVDGVIQVHL